ncbi:hypothetical protein [Agromyces archimandritae]|uniref:Uncharacterized protein n=1 Tax=Agromyces archimandritae TaxID=2781962 RepID=A0A975FLU3_9MICO|nr:hypothetical protein [Agromyces archimandritae]QTX03346.1 hypothetical protein G127AT_08095 [Agromyces archimandritae]
MATSDQEDNMPQNSWRVICGAGILALCGTLSGCAALPEHQSSVPRATSAEDFQQRLAACMDARGWSSTPGADGTAEFEVPLEQESAFTEDNDACTVEAGGGEVELSDADYERLYEAVVELRECLNEEGFEIPEPPSFHEFRDGSGEWTPYTMIDQEELFTRLDELNEACPMPFI